MSSTTIGPQHENDAASASGSDSKKRNKLGYHRTAVACAHCRKRKIRCVQSTELSESRCQNCIRLKKGCQFFPTDQDAVPARKLKADYRIEAATTTQTSPYKSPSREVDLKVGKEQYDGQISDASPSEAVWTQGSSFATSTDHLVQQGWTASAQAQTQAHYAFRGENVGQDAYWMPQHEPLNSRYAQQPYGPVTTGTSYSQGSALVYDRPPLDHDRHSSQRQDSHVTQSNETIHLQVSYPQYDTTFPGPERSMNLPAGYGYTQYQANPSTQASPSLSGHEQHTLTQLPSPQLMQNIAGAQWYPITSSQQTFAPSHLPSQTDRHYRYAEHSG